MRNPLGQLAITALLALVVLAACSNDGLSDYLDRVDHVMDAHYNELAIADAAFDDFQACTPQALIVPEFVDCNADFCCRLEPDTRECRWYTWENGCWNYSPRRGVAIPRVDP